MATLPVVPMTTPPNFLLIILDALRGDAVGDPFGAPERCLRAPTAVAAAPWTLPSCTSIITGRRPVAHGHYWREPALGTNALLEGLPSGYRKVGFVNNGAIGRGSGVEHGFDKWRLSLDHDEPIERALRLIGRVRSRRPHLIVLHSNIVHDYYLPSADRFRRPGRPRPTVPALGERVVTWRDTTPADRTAALDAYGDCTTELLTRVATVLDAVRQRDDFVTVVTADHGEGFDPDRGRIHHAGRVHQDLLDVPLFFDLPSTTPADRVAALADALATRAVFGTDILPTAFDLGGLGGMPPTDGVSVLSGDPRTLVSEDRRYLYVGNGGEPGRFRINFQGRFKNMSAEDLDRNRRIAEQLAEPPAVRSFLLHPHKCIVTSVRLRSGSGAKGLRDDLVAFGADLLGAPVLAIAGDRLLGLEYYDLAADPLETRNLVAAMADGPRGILGTPVGESVSMPVAGVGEVGLVQLLEGCEIVSGPHG